MLLRSSPISGGMKPVRVERPDWFTCGVYFAAFVSGLVLGSALGPEAARSVGLGEVMNNHPLIEWFVRGASAVVLGVIAMGGAIAVQVASQGEKPS